MVGFWWGFGVGLTLSRCAVVVFGVFVICTTMPEKCVLSVFYALVVYLYTPNTKPL